MPREKIGHFYYEWFPTIYGADTQRLTLAEDGAYRRLIDHYMLTRGELPLDDKALSRIIGVGWQEWEDVKDAVLAFFKKTPTGYRHSFCEDQIAAHNARLTKYRNNGSKGGRPPKPMEKKEDKPIGLQDETNRFSQTEQNKQTSFIEEAPDFKKIIFDSGLKFLSIATGKTADKLRPMLGAWCRDHGDSATATAIMEAQKFQAVEPISFIQNHFKGGKNAATKPNSAAGARPNKAERAEAAVRRAAESGGFAGQPGSETKTGGDVAAELELPAFLRKGAGTT